ncbi:MAG: VOC family protein [Vicinamibacterales bacterium]|jgi:catechol 2,3-dioxygenase-like lactoylglutathione lyase family enzyme|nr:VOC family protein [Vicinamibacterales bacterium]
MTARPRTLVLAVSLMAALTAARAAAQPVPESERIPVDVRRTTLVVRDIDRSLVFWRDALGLKVVYDRMLFEPPNQTRLVLLRANDEFIGLIGLMERQATKATAPPVAYERASYGNVIFVINAKDQEQRLEKVRKVPGVKLQGEPQRIEYPSPDGKGTIPVMVTYLWDPDGYFVELNKLLGTPAGKLP